jgi:hypothetical protein
VLPLTTRRHRSKLWAAIGAGLSVTLLVVVLLSVWIANSRSTRAGTDTSNNEVDEKEEAPPEKVEYPPLSFDWHEFSTPVYDGKKQRGLSAKLYTSPGNQLNDGTPSPIANHPSWANQYWLCYGTFEEGDFKVMVVRDGNLPEATPLSVSSTSVGVSYYTQLYTCWKTPVRSYTGYVHKSINPAKLKSDPPPEFNEFMRTHR